MEGEMKSTFASLPLIVGMGLALLVTTPDLEARADSREEDRPTIHIW